MLRQELLDEGFDINTLAPSQAVFYAMLAGGLCQAQAHDEALAVVERALEQARASAGVWFNPELLRIKACVLAAQGTSPSSVESCFGAARTVAREQGGLYWELRAALSHAQYLLSLSRSPEAHAVLRPVYTQFTQGFDLSELRAARDLLNQFAS